ncbi:MAG: hydrolase [Dorea sp.]|jgi:cell wall-associated NlpC family hydrolase|nr:hydrolase [Dorea sp.]
MRRRIAHAITAALLVSTLVVTPAFATSLEDMQANKAQAENEASSLQQQITRTLDKIDTLEKDLEAKKVEIDQAGEKLEEAAARQSEQYGAMKLRIKYMYEEGESNFLEAMLTATSFSDFINKAEYVQEVHSYDRTKLDEYEDTTKQVEALKNGLEEEYVQMETLQTDLEAEKSTLNATLEEKQDEIAQLDESIQAAIAARREEERRAREAAAREAEAREAAAREAAAQQQANAAGNAGNGGSGNNTQGGASSGNNGSGGGSSYVPPQGSDGWAVVAYARQFIGNPYVYGGNSLTNGIDCSGFTQQIYGAFGVSLPRVDSAQATCGVEIPLSQAQAGDLLCYWGHVGIYNGAGGIIHASSPGVGIVEFSNCQYRTLKCVRRVL